MRVCVCVCVACVRACVHACVCVVSLLYDCMAVPVCVADSYCANTQLQTSQRYVLLLPLGIARDVILISPFVAGVFKTRMFAKVCMTLASTATCRPVRWELVPLDWVEPVATMLPIAAKTHQLDGIDCFAGEKGFAKAMLRHQLMGVPFEKHDDPEWEDVLSAKGFSNLFFLLLRVRAHGLVLLGPHLQVLDLLDPDAHEENAIRPCRF